MGRTLIQGNVVKSTFVAAVMLIGAGCWCPSLPDPLAKTDYLLQVNSPLEISPAGLSYYRDLIVRDNPEMGGGTITFGGLSDTQWISLLALGLADSVECRPIRYRSRDVNGEPIQLTGMLYLPKNAATNRCARPVSLITYPHGTELHRGHVPSRNAGDEWIFGAAAAIFTGNAVAMPDLPGMGDAVPERYHPYCHAQSLAYSVIDMARAARECFLTELHGEYTWDGRLYVLGYSEGGYAAMATVKELQVNAERYPDLHVTGAACLAGPYDLSGVMRRMMTDPSRQFSEPYFLPYLILGYYAVYGERFSPVEVLSPVLLPDLLMWMNGEYDGDEVDAWLALKLGLVSGEDPIPRTLLNSQWIRRQIEDDVFASSEIGLILTENDLWSGWAPTCPMLMLHSPDDDCVPYANSQKAYDAFVAAGAGANVTFAPIGNPGDGITHIQGAVLGIPKALVWIRDECPKN